MKQGLVFTLPMRLGRAFIFMAYLLEQEKDQENVTLTHHTNVCK